MYACNSVSFNLDLGLATDFPKQNNCSLKCIVSAVTISPSVPSTLY